MFFFRNCATECSFQNGICVARYGLLQSRNHLRSLEYMIMPQIGLVAAVQRGLCSKPSLIFSISFGDFKKQNVQ